MIPKNPYAKASEERDEQRLFPSLAPSDDVKRDIWRKHHMNSFWSSYTGVDEVGSCPVCRSSSYEEEEKQLEAGEYSLETVLTWYRCSRCSHRWVCRQ